MEHLKTQDDLIFELCQKIKNHPKITDLQRAIDRFFAIAKKIDNAKLDRKIKYKKRWQQLSRTIEYDLMQLDEQALRKTVQSFSNRKFEETKQRLILIPEFITIRAEEINNFSIVLEYKFKHHNTKKPMFGFDPNYKHHSRNHAVSSKRCVRDE